VASTLDAPYHWTSKHHLDGIQIYDEVDRVETSHPVFVIPEGVAERTKDYFAAKGGF
jgi:protein farnesyltransferase subunit beta